MLNISEDALKKWVKDAIAFILATALLLTTLYFTENIYALWDVFFRCLILGGLGSSQGVALASNRHNKSLLGDVGVLGIVLTVFFVGWVIAQLNMHWTIVIAFPIGMVIGFALVSSAYARKE